MSFARPLSRALPSALPSALTGSGATADAYEANGFSPELVGDFRAGTYRANGSSTNLASLIPAERSGLAVLTDSGGNAKWNAHNLVINSGSPATQSVTVVSGADYTVKIEGSGSVALSGAGTGTVTDGSPVTITASTTSLTLTVTGSPDRMWAIRSDLGGMVDVPAAFRTSGAASDYLATTGTARYLPRYGHHKWNGSAWVPKGALIERVARTNLFPEPLLLDDPAWTSTNQTVTSGQSDPWGGTAAYRFVASSASAIFFDAAAVTSGVDYTVSCWVKKNGTGAGQDAFRLFGDNGQLGPDLTATDQWRRYSFTCTAALSGSRLFGLDANSAGNLYDILVYGFQIEAGLTPSSLIPDGLSTRTADPALTVAAANAPYNAAGVAMMMTGEIDYADQGTLGNPALFRRTISTGARIEAYNDTRSSDTGRPLAVMQKSAEALISEVATDYTPGVGVPFAVALRAKPGLIQVAADGAAAAAQTGTDGFPDVSTQSLEVALDTFMGTVALIAGWGADPDEAGIEEASTAGFGG